MSNHGKVNHALLGGIHLALVLFGILTALPFLWLIVNAFKSNADFFNSIFLPTGDGLLGIAWGKLTLENFWKLFSEADFLRNVVNSFFLASTAAVIACLLSAMGGYALAKFRFPGRLFFTGVVLSALVIPGTLLLAPTYQLLFQLGLLNSFAGLLLPGFAPAFGVFLFRQAILNAIPNDMLESARIDGAGEFRIFFEMVLPLVRPMAGAFLLLTFMGMWNNFILPQIILQSPENFPLAVAIAQLRDSYGQDYGMIFAATVVSISPVILLFLLLQREFITGLTSGAIKA